jgi:hypothetical protein
MLADLFTVDIRITKVETGTLDVTITAVGGAAVAIAVIHYAYKWLSQIVSERAMAYFTNKSVEILKDLRKDVREHRAGKGKSDNQVDAINAELVECSRNLMRHQPYLLHNRLQIDPFNLRHIFAKSSRTAPESLDNAPDATVQLPGPDSPNPPVQKS